MKGYTTTEFRKNLSDLFSEVYLNHERIIITRKKENERIALIPMDDFKLLTQRKADSSMKEFTKTRPSEKDFKFKRITWHKYHERKSER